MRIPALKITDEMVQAFHAKMKAKADAQVAFFESDLCKRMTADIALEPLTCDDVHYFFEATQAKYSWGDVTREQMDMFVSVMSDGPTAEAVIDNPNPENPFCHSYHLKGGLVVWMMHGQGTVVTIMAPEHAPEVYAQLQAIAAAK